MERKNLWTVYSEEQLAHLESLNESYKKYLDAGKTERECVREAVKLAEAAGYKNLDEVIAAGDAVNYMQYAWKRHLHYSVLEQNQWKKV